VGNLAGSLGLAWLVAQSGVMGQAPQSDLLLKVAALKMNLPMWELFIRGILCNWLVCLAVWTAARTTSDAAKIMLIFWCLFAFIGSGFEHSIANQSLLGIALFLPHSTDISWAGFIWNQLWVVSGNIVGGVVFVGGAYWVTSPVSGWFKKSETISGVVEQESSRLIRMPVDGKLLPKPVTVCGEP
jgi:nitrite transporter NirC